MDAARKAAGPWAARTAYNRGQILYRAAEALESRADALAEPDELAAAVDVLVHYAGWTDKLPAVLGGVNPVAMPYLSFSLPEPTGVVGVLAPDEPPLLGLVAEIAPALAAGNTVVAVDLRALAAAGARPREVLGVSDVPAAWSTCSAGGAELAPALGPTATSTRSSTPPATPSSPPSSTAWRPRRQAARHGAPATTYEAATDDALARLEAFTELKTAWHPVGA